MPYWKRARAWARDHAETYSLKKAAPAVVIALVQYLYSSGSVFQRTLISIGLILLSYLLLLALEFLWKMLIAAPVALDAEHAVDTTRLESKIRDLDERLEAPKVPELERSRRDLVRSKLKDCTPDDFAVLKYILQNGQADVVHGESEDPDWVLVHHDQFINDRLALFANSRSIRRKYEWLRVYHDRTVKALKRATGKREK
jgi:hypothetical protein